MSATSPSPPRSSRRGLRAGLGALVTVIAIVVVLATSSSPTPTKIPPVTGPHRPGPESMFTAGGISTYTPANLDLLKQLGIDRVHIYLHWADVAPDPTSSRRPAFDATDPAAYPASGWAPFDGALRALAARHMTVDLDLVPPPPDWAGGKGAPRSKTPHPEWNPSAAQFGQFVRSVGTRYSGHYTPPGSSRPLPRIGFWSIWNEPDLGTQLAPEAIDHSTVEVAPRYYRGLVNAAWSAFGATGHGHDTILIGELAPAGVHSGVGNYNQMQPLRFLRALYCVDSSYRPLRGTAATLRGCPATAAASARFATDNPGLFKASGFADHPYSQGLAPNLPTPGEPDYAELAATGKLEHVLDVTQRVYGSKTKFPIWSTEFGYQTTPPDTEAGTVSPATAAAYLNWSEYLTWLDPRERSFDQYLLADPPGGAFATGLLTATGVPKPGFYAFRMPLYLPVTSNTAGHPLDVWGCVRPAPLVAKTSHRTQIARIQFRSGGGAFRTLRRVPITDKHGYFELRMTFPASGEVRLAWAPPHAPTEFSRTVAVTLR